MTSIGRESSLAWGGTADAPGEGNWKSAIAGELDTARATVEVNMKDTSHDSPTPWREALTAAPVHDPPRVLVAEDDKEMRQLVSETLRKDGYDVVAVNDGGRLLVTLAHEYVDKDGVDLVDLVVSDVRMPVCSGIEILEQLRAARWRVPVILMTAFGDSDTRSHARSLGAVLFDKPFDLDDLRTAAACLLRRGP